MQSAAYCSAIRFFDPFELIGIAGVGHPGVCDNPYSYGWRNLKIPD